MNEYINSIKMKRSIVLISLIATAYGAGVNIFEYLQALQKNQISVNANPSNWLPWNYEKSLELNLKELKPDKNLSMIA